MIAGQLCNLAYPLSCQHFFEEHAEHKIVLAHDSVPGLLASHSLRSLWKNGVDMISEEVRDILCQPVIVRVTTITAEGYPHTVPVWFILDGDDLVLFTERKAKKVANASINPKGSIAIGGDPVGSPTLLAEGDFVIEDDPNYVMTERITRHYDPENAEQWLEMWKKSDYVILRLKLRRLIRIV